LTETIERVAAALEDLGQKAHEANCAFVDFRWEVPRRGEQDRIRRAIREWR
jgi:hypothetical protein